VHPYKESKFTQSEEIQVTQTQPVSTNNIINVSCNRCGNNNPIGSKFCNSCGSKRKATVLIHLRDARTLVATNVTSTTTIYRL
jgi:rRNA maturation endonuclease Nob1